MRVGSSRFLFCLLPTAYCLLSFERRGKKREGENERGDQGENLSLSPKGFCRLNKHGMTEAKKKQDHCPGDPAIPAKISQWQQNQDKAARDIPAFIAQNGVQDMSAIELSHGKQI